MRRFATLFLTFFPLLLAGDEQVKQILCEKQKALCEAASDVQMSQLHYELAEIYFKDQELDLAFSHFLEALKTQEKFPSFEIDEREALYYHEALQLYLTHAGRDPIPVAEEMLQTYEKIATCHPEFLHLNFLMAMAYANLGKYDSFFQRFYRGYPYLHDTFLAYKTQGILYLRLSHHGKSIDERKSFQDAAFHNLSLALARNPQDSSLYKVLLFLAKDEKNDVLVRSYLQKMVHNRVKLPRSDIFLYVREAVALEELVVAQAIIDLAKAHYDYSRAISSAQEYLNKHRG